MLLLLLLLFLSTSPLAAAEADAGDTELDVILDSTQHWVGQVDVLFSVFGPDGTPLADRGVELSVELVGPTGQRVRNEPANLAISIRAIAEIKTISEAHVVDAVVANTRKLYGF